MTRTILLADDSVTIQKVVELTFLDEDFKVVTFGDGSEAIARLAEVSPDLVITDVHMPGADGYEVAEAARKHRPGVPILLLVGTFESFDEDRAAEVGASGHLKKPFDSQELLRRARELVESGAAGGAPEVTPPPAVEASLPAFDAGAAESEPAFAPPPDLDLPAAPQVAPTPEPEPVASTAPDAGGPPAAPAGNGSLTDADVERIAHRVAELIGDKVVRDVAWEVVPDLAEVLLKARIRELEASVE